MLLTGIYLHKGKTLRKKKLEKLKEEKFWASLRFFARLPGDFEEIPAHINHFRCKDAGIDDYWLEKLVSAIKSINMLDLDENEITNEGIYHLTKLENLKELRLKECNLIDNGCLEYLNQIHSLELLHIGGTSITIDHLIKLNGLVKLKTLLVSSDLEKETVREILSPIGNELPECEFIVNHKLVDLY